MSISSSLLAFGVRYVFDGPIEGLLHAIETRLTDHGQALPRALARANDRAWQAVGLALGGEGLFERFKDVFRDADLKGVREQIKQFLDHTPTGLETVNAANRRQAGEEWQRLRKAKRLSAESIPPEQVARRAASMERYGDPGQVAIAAHRAVEETAAALKDDAPNLAALLTYAPPNGTPLLVAAFGFFFRREVETNPELARGLSFDFLKHLSERQERGFRELEVSLGGQLGAVLDRLDGLFDELGKINAKLEQLIRMRDVPTSTSDPLKVTVTNKGELELLQKLRNALRELPPELVAATDWSKLGDTLAAAGLFREAKEAHEAAAAAAKVAADRKAEAEAEYKRFRDSCETGDRATALAAFQRAVELDPERFTPFDLHRYQPRAILGVGGFGTVFLADDLYVLDKDRQPQKVAIKAVHDSGWDALLERDLAETFDEANTLSALNHPGIIKTLNRGFGDPARRQRPYLVLEYFDGVPLDAWLRAKGPLPLNDVLAIANRVAEAVHAAHQHNIYHRDIKPANVLVAFEESTRQWQVKVIDFGLAVKLHVARTSLSVPSGRRANLDRSLAGTLRYSPPEQRNELDADVGPYSDVYAWGKTCLDLLFGTTEAKSLHWKELPEENRDRVQTLLELATLDAIAGVAEHKRRFASFEPVLAELARLLGNERSPEPGRPSVQEVPVSRIGQGPRSASERPQSTERIARPEPDHQPGEIMTVKIPRVDRGLKPGTLTALTWKPCSAG